MSTPKLRFSNEPMNLKKFGELYEFKTTNSFSRELLNYEDGEVKNIHYGDIHTKFKTHFSVKNEHVPFINLDVHLAKIKEECYCSEGDLVIADASEDYKDIGKCIEIMDIGGQKILAGLHTFLAKPISQDIAKGYMSYAMQGTSVRKQVMTIAQGTKVLSISAGRLSNVSFLMPPVKEQKKIASFLSKIDQKISLLTKKYELLAQYKKGVMQKIFSQEFRFQDKGGRDYPKWELKKIGDALTIGSGRDYKHLSPGNIPVYGTGGFMLSVNDFLYDGVSACIGRKGTIDKPVLLSGKFWTVDTLFYTHKFINCSPEFIYACFQMINWKSYCEASGVPSLSKSTIEAIEISLPCIAEQKQITDFFAALDNKITNIKSKLALSKQYKQGLLQQMFI